MTKNLAYASLISAALVGSVAFAQHDTRPSTVNQPVHKANPPPVCAPAHGQPAAPTHTPACVPTPGQQAVHRQGPASASESSRSSLP
ncbi:MAG TPA: hypothetical protein VFE63_13505 [Roseiarcus sp.]|nr:hypothetical protein [Roseiarcus sp.]